MTRYVDSNVLIDLFHADPVWGDWSRDALARGRKNGPLLISPIVFAEVSGRFARWEDALEAVRNLYIEVAQPLSFPTLHRAAEVMLAYRRQSGARGGLLADFLIGAQAETDEVPLITRDPRRYRTYFPDLKLIAP